MTEPPSRGVSYFDCRVNAHANGAIALDPATRPRLARGRLDDSRADAAEIRGEELFFGKAQCGVCHPAPTYTDNQMHDLRVEELYHGRSEGWAKTFTLRGIKDGPPYFHDRRLPTFEDSVEFLNILLGTELTAAEKDDLVSFLLCL